MKDHALTMRNKECWRIPGVIHVWQQHNRITEQDIELIQLFKVVDLGGNPLNCLFDFETLNSTILLSNCTLHTTPSVGQWTSPTPLHNHQVRQR